MMITLFLFATVRLRTNFYISYFANYHDISINLETYDSLNYGALYANLVSYLR